MRVAFDATSLLGPRTGVATFAHEVLRGLSARPGIDVVAFAASWRGRGMLRGVVPDRVEVAEWPMAARPLRKAWLRMDRPTIELWTGKVDLVHGPNFVVPPAHRAVSVVSIHDLTVLRYPELCTDDTLQYPPLIQRAVDRGAWVHTISAFVPDIVEAFGADPERVVAIPNGVTDVTEGDADAGRKLAGSDRYILGLGTIEPRKNFPLLVEAFDRLAEDDTELRLVIAGPDGWGADALTDSIDRATHASRILRTGWVDDVDRADLLHGASVFAYPSAYEGFGFPPLEAMASDTPVVATRVGGVPETVGDAARLVPAGDLDALAAALREVLDDPAVAAGLVARGRTNLERFSWERTTDLVVELYERAIAAGRP